MTPVFATFAVAKFHSVPIQHALHGPTIGHTNDVDLFSP